MSAADRVPPTDPEVEALCIREVGKHAGLLVDDAVAEPLERREVEPLRGFEVGDVDGDVREGHCGSWQTASRLLPSASWTNAA
jgi:hypothetical protein